MRGRFTFVAAAIGLACWGTAGGRAKATMALSPGAFERRLYSAMTRDPLQQRRNPVLIGKLSEVARRHAEDMVRRRYFGHTDLAGLGPNGRVARSGIPLPAEFAAEPSENYIESIARGRLTPEAMWRCLARSPSHREHVLGLDGFWGSQRLVGVGAAWDARRRDYVCVVVTVP